MSLTEQTLFGEVDKVAIAIERLRSFQPKGKPYWLAFSGGKDSQVIYHLAEEAGIDYEAVYNHTTVDPPELMHFMQEHYPNVRHQMPELTMWKLIEREAMLPTRRIRFCCRVLKEQDAPPDRTLITGIRWAESARRKGTRKMVEACYRHPGRRIVNPIIDWTEADIWEFHKSRNLPHCCLYDEDRDRIGCVMCPMAGTAGMKRDAERWPTYRIAYEHAIQRAINRRKAEGKPLSWATGAEAIEWWISGESAKTEDDELTLFG